MLMEGIVIQTIHIVSDFEMCCVIFFFLFESIGGLLRMIGKLLMYRLCLG